MKIINSIIKDSAVGNLTNPYKYAILCIFSGIMITAISLLTFMLTNISYVSASFNF
jgi:hypothetical protein